VLTDEAKPIQTQHEQVEADWGLQRPFPCRLPLVSSFNCGFGRGLFQKGQLLQDRAWLHLSSTQLLPSAGSTRGGGAAAEVQLQLTTETAFEGGSCVAVLLNYKAADQAAAVPADKQQQQAAAVQMAQLCNLQLPLEHQTALSIECVARLGTSTSSTPAPHALALILQLAAEHPGSGSPAQHSIALLLLQPQSSSYSSNAAGASSPLATLLENALTTGSESAAAAAAATAPVLASLPVAIAAGAAAGSQVKWQQWQWELPAATLQGLTAITGCSVAVVQQGESGGGRAQAARAQQDALPIGSIALVGEYWGRVELCCGCPDCCAPTPPPHPFINPPHPQQTGQLTIKAGTANSV